MPELPEVETVRRGLLPFIGSTIRQVESENHPRFLAAERSKDYTLHNVLRRGKYLILQCSKGIDEKDLILHLGMTGKVLVGEEEKHRRVRFELTQKDKQYVISFCDSRKFGRVFFLPRGVFQDAGLLGKIGPEPLEEENAEEIIKNLEGKAATIKSVLLGQIAVAGVGNIYADEALFLSKLNPTQRFLTKAQGKILLANVKKVLSQGILNGGTTLRDYQGVEGLAGENQNHLLVYGRGGQACTVCGQTLERSVVAGRGTVWCSKCQPETIYSKPAKTGKNI